jgi:hypothetical protein
VIENYAGKFGHFIALEVANGASVLLRTVLEIDGGALE